MAEEAVVLFVLTLSVLFVVLVIAWTECGWLPIFTTHYKLRKDKAELEERIRTLQRLVEILEYEVNDIKARAWENHHKLDTFGKWEQTPSIWVLRRKK